MELWALRKRFVEKQMIDLGASTHLGTVGSWLQDT